MMLRSRLFQKHYFIIAFIILAFLFLGFFLNHMVMRFNSFMPPGNRSGVFFAKLIHQLNPADHVQALKTYEEMNQDTSFPFQLALLNKNGDLIYPENFQISNEPPRKPPFPLSVLGPPPPPRGGPGPGPGPETVKLPGDSGESLMIVFKGGGRPPPMFGFFMSAGIVFLSIVLGIGFSLFLIFRSFHKTAVLAGEVINELQRGNLKARFPIKKMDEIGVAMSRFNIMADEIERLVEHLKNVEKSRTVILQELAHDLRTPLASLKNLIEILHFKQDKLNKEASAELLEMSLREVQYFERLVEDLLFLSQVSEPHYKSENGSVNLKETIDSEIEAVLANTKNKQIELINSAVDPKTLGDIHLIRRAVRNALSNSASFAKSKVFVELKSDESQQLIIQISDDGPGFSEEALQNYGVRRVTRVSDPALPGRVSLGLGSVIIRRVVDLHRGSLKVENLFDADQQVTGSRLQIILPK